jgi:hypothetical protein
MSGKKTASAEELDRMFDAGEDMADYFDFSSTRPAARRLAALAKKPDATDSKPLPSADNESEIEAVRRRRHPGR